MTGELTYTRPPSNHEYNNNNNNNNQQQQHQQNAETPVLCKPTSSTTANYHPYRPYIAPGYEESFEEAMSTGGYDGRVIPPPPASPATHSQSAGGFPGTGTKATTGAAGVIGAAPMEPPTDGETYTSATVNSTPFTVGGRKRPTDVDYQLFKGCRDSFPLTALQELAGYEAGGDVNIGWFRSENSLRGLGWDVIPMDVVEGEGHTTTSYFWPVDSTKPQTKKNEPKNGDTLLHMAFKLGDGKLLEFLASCEGLDLNAVNESGETGVRVAESIGKGNMYSFFFVL